MPRKVAPKVVKPKPEPPPPKGADTFHHHHLPTPLFFVWRSIMAKLTDVEASLAKQTTAIQAQTQAIADLTARFPPPAAATEDDLEKVKTAVDTNTATVDTNTAAIAGLAPATR